MIVKFSGPGWYNASEICVDVLEKTRTIQKAKCGRKLSWRESVEDNPLFNFLYSDLIR